MPGLLRPPKKPSERTSGPARPGRSRRRRLPAAAVRPGLGISENPVKSAHYSIDYTIISHPGKIDNILIYTLFFPRKLKKQWKTIVFLLFLNKYARKALFSLYFAEMGSQNNCFPAINRKIKPKTQIIAIFCKRPIAKTWFSNHISVIHRSINQNKQ